jgi:hypothetical protein
MKTLLQLVQAASGEMGLQVPTFVAGSQQQDVIQLQYLANAVGDELAREYDWQALNKDYRFTTSYGIGTGNLVAGSTTISGLSSLVPSITVDTTYMVTGTGIPQDTWIVTSGSGTATISQPATISGTGVTLTVAKNKYSMPSDYDRQIDRTHYDKSKRWAMIGPETAQQWEFIKSSYIATGPRVRYRIYGGYFQIWPMMSTNEYLGFDYVSNAWVTDVSLNPKTSLTADTDTTIFADRLFVVALKRKYFSIKGFGPQFDAEFNRQLSIAKANDGGSQTLAMAAQPSSVLVGYENLPDSFTGTGF